jgi:hypothetical protein
MQRGDLSDHDDRGDSVAVNENDNEDLRFMQYGTHDGSQDDGEVNSQERLLVQDNRWKRKQNGVNAKYNESTIAITKQKAKFLEEAMKNRQPENEHCFSQPFTPRHQHTSQYEITYQKPHQQVVDEFAYPLASSTLQPCPFSLSSSPSA